MEDAIRMKIYLASFFQPEYHGSGRIISISHYKPDDIIVDLLFEPFAPSKEISEQYLKDKVDKPLECGRIFEANYINQLSNIMQQLEGVEDKMSAFPLQDEDTLVSWERKGYTNYRNILAEYLKDIGYDVVLN